MPPTLRIAALLLMSFLIAPLVHAQTNAHLGLSITPYQPRTGRPFAVVLVADQRATCTVSIHRIDDAGRAHAVAGVRGQHASMVTPLSVVFSSAQPWARGEVVATCHAGKNTWTATRGFRIAVAGPSSVRLRAAPPCPVAAQTHSLTLVATGLHPHETVGFGIVPNTLGLLGVRQAGRRGTAFQVISVPPPGRYIVEIFRGVVPLIKGVEPGPGFKRVAMTATLTVAAHANSPCRYLPR
jgi:hypothetical protein